MIIVDELTIEYPSPVGPVRPIERLSFELPAAHLAALVGPSGSGKTSVLSTLSGMVRPAAGSVEVAGRHVADLEGADLAHFRRHSVGIIFQGFNLLPALTAAENVAAPMIMAGEPRREALEEAHRMLEAVGLSDRAAHLPRQMSGGQQQRVAVARGLSGGPSVVLADEPTANLDAESATLVIELLRSVASDGRTVLVSTHDDRILPVMDSLVSLVRSATAAADDGADRPSITLEPGEVLLRRGDPSDAIYRVESGTLDVIAPTEHGDDVDGEVIARLGPGSHVGELGVLMGAPRSATVRAGSAPASVAEVSVAEFRRARTSLG